MRRQVQDRWARFTTSRTATTWKVSFHLKAQQPTRISSAIQTATQATSTSSWEVEMQNLTALGQIVISVLKTTQSRDSEGQTQRRKTTPSRVTPLGKTLKPILKMLHSKSSLGRGKSSLAPKPTRGDASRQKLHRERLS